MNKNILSKKHGTCLFIIILLYILTVIFKTNTIYLPVLNIILCLLLIHYYLREPFFSYGLSFKKIHIQIICGLLLAAIILFYLYGNAFTWNIYPFVIGRFMRHFSSYPALWFYFFNIFARALYEEITFRGIFLSFFQSRRSNRFSRRALETTQKLERLMAAAPNMGFSFQPKAV